MSRMLIIAVDFDDTIAHSKFPEIVGPVQGAIQSINSWADRGHYIIVNTCRSGDAEVAAKKWLDENGVLYDAINKNHPALIELFGGDCRKISADIYIDDKNACTRAFMGGVNWFTMCQVVSYLETVDDFRGMLDYTA